VSASHTESSAHCLHRPSNITQLWQLCRTRLFTQAINSLLIGSRNAPVLLLNTPPSPSGTPGSRHDTGKRSALSTRPRRCNFSLSELESQFPSSSSAARTTMGPCSWRWAESTASTWVKSARNARSPGAWGITTAANTASARILQRPMPSSQNCVPIEQDWTGSCCRRRGCWNTIRDRTGTSRRLRVKRSSLSMAIWDPIIWDWPGNLQSEVCDWLEHLGYFPSGFQKRSVDDSAYHALYKDHQIICELTRSIEPWLRSPEGAKLDRLLLGRHESCKIRRWKPRCGKIKNA